MTAPACCAWRTRSSISKRCNRARRGEIPQRLDNRTQFRNIARLLSALRLIFRLLIEALKHLAYDLAALVADDVKHISDLEVCQALHQRGKQQHAEQKQSSDHDAGDQRHDPGPIAIDMEQNGKRISERGDEHTQRMKQLRVASQKENEPR